jgi:hypothetical protein
MFVQLRSNFSHERSYIYRRVGTIHSLQSLMNRQRVTCELFASNRASGRRLNSALLLCGFFVIALVFVSCEKQDGAVIDFSGAAPHISGAVVNPASALLESFPGVSGTYTVTAQVSATVTDPQGIDDIREVRYSLFKPGEQTSFAQGSLVPSQTTAPSGARNFTANITFPATRTETGDYRCVVGATDQGALNSNILDLRFSLLLKSSPPILGLPGIRLMTQHGSDSLYFALTIDVRDSNGYGTIRTVTVRPLGARDSSSRQMFDDGQSQHADNTIGDGVFSIQTWVSPAQQLSDIVFEFSAIDADGLKAEPVRRAYANRPPKFVSMNIPSTITRPTSGTKLVTFFAAVSDPDGLADVDSVYFRNLSSSNPVILLMYDDGDLTAHGDSVARDGTYARTLSIDPTTTAGNKLFQFSAVDKGRARVDSTRTITID